MSDDLILNSDARRRRMAAELEASRRDRERIFAEALERDRTLELPDRKSLEFRWDEASRRGLIAGLEDDLQAELSRAEVLRRQRERENP